MDESVFNMNSYAQDSNPDGAGYSVADQEDADAGLFGRILSGTSASTPPFNPAGSDSGFLTALSKGLDSALSFTLKRDQLGLQQQMLNQGRSVGYYPGMPMGQPGADAGLIRLLMIFGIGYVVVKAVS